MKVVSATFVISAVNPAQYPQDGRPEFAFVGRSNVGKSSLMNALVQKNGLAKTSSRPGKTQLINFFEVNESLYFVDLPGYGYAKVPLRVKRKWARAMTAYLRERAALKLVTHLVDARHAPTEQDLEMLELLDEAEVPTLIVATKIDKVRKSQRKKNLARIRETLGLDGDALIVAFSSVTGEGQREIFAVVDAILEG